MGTLLKPTNISHVWLGSDFTGSPRWQLQAARWIWLGLDFTGSPRWQPVAARWKWNGTAWKMVYSTPTGTLSGGGAIAISGPTPNGTPQVSATATPGGVHSGNLSYQWQHSSGPNNYSYANTNTAVIIGSYAFTGVANDATASLPAEQVYCIITDTVTGAQYSTDPITIGPFSHHNTIPAYTPISLTYGIDGSTPTGSGSAGSVGYCFASATGNVVVHGGNGSYSYTWSKLSNNGFTNNASNSAYLTCSKSDYFGGVDYRDYNESWRCTVTDGVSSASLDFNFGIHLECTND